MDEATAESLGEKLGGLDLTDDEAFMLAVLLGAEPDGEPEVEGFGRRARSFTEWNEDLLVTENLEVIRGRYSSAVVAGFLERDIIHFI